MYINEIKLFWSNQTERYVSDFRLGVQYTKKCYRVATFESLISIFIYIFWFTVSVKSLILNLSSKLEDKSWVKAPFLTPHPTHTYTTTPPIESY